MEQEKNILFYDGGCGLCQGSVKWLLKWEEPGIQTREPLYFAALQSDYASHLPAGLPDSVVLLMDGKIYTKSEAVCLLCLRCKPPMRWVSRAIVLPLFLRDAVYDTIARIRKWTRTDVQLCDVLDPGLRSRILG